MDEFFITTFSNSNYNKYNNTLTRYENDLPKTFTLSQNENWHVCLQSVGFSTDFRNMLLPKDKTLSEIVIFTEPFDSIGPSVYDNDVIINPLEWFRKLTHKINITFPNQFISVEDMRKEFRIVQDLGLQLEFVVVEDQPYRILPTFDCYLDEKHDCYAIFIHENTVESLGLSVYYGGEQILDKKAKKCFLAGELYYVYQIKYDYEMIESVRDDWKLKYPEIIKIKCDQIQEQILNSTFSQDLGILKLKFNPDQLYHIHEFENEHYVRLSNTILNKITISLTDKYDRQLNLKRGVSTFARLKFKKMRQSDNFFNVRAYSDFKNANKFTFTIPQQLYLDSNYKVALTSMHYSNKFKPLPFEEKLRTIYTTNLINNSIGDLHAYVLPNIKFYSIYQLVKLIDQFVNKSIKGKVNLMTENFDSKEFKANFHLKKGTALYLPIPIAEILGYDYEENDMILATENIVGLFSKEKEIIAIETSTEEVNVYYENIYENPKEYDRIIFTGFTNINALKPLYFMVYTDIITPCIVGSSFANLLRIIPIEYEEIDKIQEFKHKEFHSIESRLLKHINISIRSNDGNLVNFDDNSKIYLNLLFVR